MVEVLDRVKPDEGRRGRRFTTLPPTATFGLAFVASFLTVLLAVLGGSPGPLLVAALVSTGSAFAQVLSPAMALPAAVLSVLATIAVTMQLFPVLDVPLTPGVVAVLGALALAPLGALWARRDRLRRPTRDDALVAASALTVPVLTLLSLVVIEVRSHGAKLAWAMANDSAFNVMTARLVVGDGGVDLHRHFNVAPLTSELVALFMVPGRSSLAPSHLMQHDVTRAIEAVLLLLMVMGVGGSVIVARAVPARPRSVRFLVGVGAGLLPWSWFMGGYSVQYGFWNAIVAGVVLVMSWLAWVQAPQSPRLGLGLQVCAAAVLLTVWAPLVLAPAGLGAALAARHWRRVLALRRGELVACLVPLAVLLVFGYVLTKPTLDTSKGALAFDGAFFAITHATPGVVALICLAVVVLSASLRGDWWELLGVVVLVAVGWLGLHYLMDQRATAPTGPWGYYPQKFSWLMCVLAPYIAAESVVALLRNARGGKVAPAGVALGALLAGAMIMAQIPPADSRPPSTEGNPGPRLAPDFRATSMFFLLSVAHEHGASDFDPAAHQMFAWSSPRSKILVARWFHDRSLDGFMNFWLLQQPIGTGHPEVRSFAYTLDSTNASTLCAVVGTWRGGVTVKTRSPTLEREMRRACPTARFTVDLVRGGLVPRTA